MHHTKACTRWCMQPHLLDLWHHRKNDAQWGQRWSQFLLCPRTWSEQCFKINNFNLVELLNQCKGYAARSVETLQVLHWISASDIKVHKRMVLDWSHKVLILFGTKNRQVWIPWSTAELENSRALHASLLVEEKFSLLLLIWICALIFLALPCAH